MLENKLLGQLLEALLRGWGLKKSEGVGKLVLVSNFLDLDEPRERIVRAGDKEMFSKIVKDVVLNSSNHCK